MTTYDDPTYRALWAAVVSAPADAVPRSAAFDYLVERGETAERAAECLAVLPPTWWDAVSHSGSGSGIGSGRGIGSGSGSGIGSGRGIGSGIGSGIGRGSGIGSGSGIGIGIGIGSGIGSEPREAHMEPGKAYLVHCGDWHTFVGRVVRQTGPHTYLMEYCSKVADTKNGDCWDGLAAGDERLRAAADYRHYAVPVTVVLSIVAFEWAGSLPQESGSGKGTGCPRAANRED